MTDHTDELDLDAIEERMAGSTPIGWSLTIDTLVAEVRRLRVEIDEIGRASCRERV